MERTYKRSMNINQGFERSGPTDYHHMPNPIVTAELAYYSSTYSYTDPDTEA